MALAIADMKKHLEGRKFPSILTEDDYAEIVSAALGEFDRYYPIVRFASFRTRDGVQDYRIFDPEDEVTAGIAQGAIAVKDVIWSPGGDWTSLNIFSPGWQMLSQMIIFTGSYFHYPSQIMILRQKLDAYASQFGRQGWEITGPVGHKYSVLKLFPVPRANDTAVVIELGAKNTLELITDATQQQFMMWVEYYTADALANLYATTAGVNLLNFADSKDAMRYWQGKADRYHDRAVNVMSGVSGAGMRG